MQTCETANKEQVEIMRTAFINTDWLFDINTIRDAPWHVKAVMSLAVVGLLVIIGATI